ncbi:MAG: hypothetical protein AAF518_26505 [Spirochaetota bacterium]
MSLLTIATFFFFNMGDGIMNTIMPTLVVKQLGWLDTEYSQFIGMSQLISGCLGMILGTIVTDKIGHIRSIFIMMLLVVLMTLFMTFISQWWYQREVIMTFVILRDILITTINIIFFAVSMQLSWKKIAATQFAFYMSLANFSDTSGAALVKALNTLFPFTGFFYLIVFLSCIALILLLFINLNVHSLHLKKLNEK